MTGTEGTEINATVAGGTTDKKISACLRATIDWGDGATSPGTIPAEREQRTRCADATRTRWRAIPTS